MGWGEVERGVGGRRVGGAEGERGEEGRGERFGGGKVRSEGPRGHGVV